MASTDDTGNNADPSRMQRPGKPRAGLSARLPIPHPVFFALAPIVGLIDGNRDNVDPGQAVIPAAFLCAVLLLVQLGLGRMLRDGRRGAIAASLLVFLSFYAPRFAFDSWTGAAGVALTTLVAIAVIRGAADLALANRILTVTASVLLGLQLAGFLHSRITTHVPTPRAEAQRAIALAPPDDAPNIYHIVLDGYGREDVLGELYGIEPPLAGFLRELGFFVAARGHANYPQTAASLASALNFTTVQDLFGEVEPGTQSRLPLKHAIADNRLVRSLRAAGYEIVEVSTDYSLVSLANVDRRHAPALHVTELDHALLTVSGVSYLSRLFAGSHGALSSALHRRHLLHSLRAIPRAGGDGPSYVFAHLLAPHPPFVFRADASPAVSARPFVLADGDHWTMHEDRYGDDYATAYREQTLWLDTELRILIERILANDPGAVVLLHSDHGPGEHLVWEDVEATELRERMAILFAVRWPGGDYSSLDATITPINGIRILLDRLFDAGLRPIEDRSWFNTWDRPYEFVDVTSALKGPDPAPGRR